VLAQRLDRRLRIVEQAQTGGDDFAQVVRRDVGRHTDRDAGGPVQQHMRQPRRQHHRLIQRAVEVRRPVDRALAEFGEQQFGVLATAFASV
jgi:hypothetical protein